jgi:hypothetical protein
MKGGIVEEVNLFGQKEVNGVPTDAIQELFDFWKQTFNKRSCQQQSKHTEQTHVKKQSSDAHTLTGTPAKTPATNNTQT